MNKSNNIQPTSVSLQYVNEIKNETKKYSFLSKVILSVKNSIKEFLGLNKIKESIVNKNTNDNNNRKMKFYGDDNSIYFIRNNESHSNLNSLLINGNIFEYNGDNESIIDTSDNGSIIDTSDNGSIIDTSDNGSIIDTSDNGSIIDTNENGTDIVQDSADKIWLDSANLDFLKDAFVSGHYYEKKVTIIQDSNPLEQNNNFSFKKIITISNCNSFFR